jgi:hypothetical protein
MQSDGFGTERADSLRERDNDAPLTGPIDSQCHDLCFKHSGGAEADFKLPVTDQAIPINKQAPHC